MTDSLMKISSAKANDFSALKGPITFHQQNIFNHLSLMILIMLMLTGTTRMIKKSCADDLAAI